MKTFLVPNPFSKAMITFEAQSTFDAATMLWKLLQITNPRDLDRECISDISDFFDCVFDFNSVVEVV